MIVPVIGGVYEHWMTRERFLVESISDGHVEGRKADGFGREMPGQLNRIELERRWMKVGQVGRG